jgi:DNA-binding response OmpR family regulator
LREFVRRPGRVLSRDFLLDAAGGRRNARSTEAST